MRPDMPKKLVERPRWGHDLRNHDVVRGRTRGGARGLGWQDSAPAKRGKMKPRHGWKKCLNENLKPLVRFLQRRVGRRWDDVYSEIRAGLRLESPIQLHVMEHLWMYVERHVELRDGEVWALGDYPAWRSPLISRRGDRFYVDPRDGRLREAPRQTGKRQRRKGR